MIAELLALPPGSLLVLGALLVPLLRGRLLQAYLLVVPVASFAHLLAMPQDHLLHVGFFDYTLTPIRVDRLSLVWGYVFHIAAILTTIYAIHVKDRVQHVAAIIYAGAALGAVFAGDLITLFVYWEITAVSSVFLIWASRNERAYRAGMRYVMIQVGSGVLLLAGTLMHLSESGSIAFGHLGLGGLATQLIFVAFGIKCAFPLLHNWLQDAYPEATINGAVVLSAFTTKMAVYALARGFAGTEFLIWIGVAMTAFPFFYAVIENDLRRLLAYSLNIQLGFMVVGIGIGTELSLNGTASHAFSCILYTALLFMAMGAVLHRTGTVKVSELGGLYRSMPLTTVFCIIGAASISAFPLFSGFVSKSMVVTAAGDGHLLVAFLMLVFASAGVFHHSGIKIPFFAFFAHDSGIRCKEAPLNMLVAMGAAAALCIGIGCYPWPLYRILPYAVEFEPYTPTHVITQTQLLMFSALCFGFLKVTKLYPQELPSVNLDSDWVYRRVLPGWAGAIGRAADDVYRGVARTAYRRLVGLTEGVFRHYGPEGIFARSWPTGSTVLWVAIILCAFLLAYYL